MQRSGSERRNGTGVSTVIESVVGSSTCILAACSDDRILQDERLRFLLLCGAAANEYPYRFLEIEQPKRHLQIGNIDHVREIPKRGGVLVVGIQEDDVRTWMLGEHCRQDQGDCAGFARPGGPDHCKVLCQELVHHYQCRPSWI